jgi:uncharacterized protein
VLGRLLQTSWWRIGVLAVGFLLFTWATLISSLVAADATDGSLRSTLASTDPFDRGLLYTASALGTALLAFGLLSWMAERFSHAPLVRTLQVAGQMTLTLYIAHALVFNLLVDWWGWVQPTGLATPLTFAGLYWVVGIAFAWAWSQRYRRGPLEVVYRRLTA